MMKRRIGARAGLRWSLFAVGAVAVLSTITIDVADARSRRHRVGHRIARAAGYNPPYSAIVVDANSGKVLHAANADSIRHPASLTKVMTLYLLFEQIEAGKLRLDSELSVSAHAASQAPSKLGVRPGQSIDVDDAIKALVTKSANDVAVVIAEAIGGEEEDFARMMTRKARALGMSRTVYANASGLPDDDQVTTARDQATLGRAIQERFPKLYRYFATPNFNYHGRSIRNHNNLLGRVEGIDGIKTGYIRKSGFNLISSMRRGDRHLVAAVLGGSSGRWRDARMASLLEQNWMLASAHRSSGVTEVAEVIDAPARTRAAAADAVAKSEAQNRSEASARAEAAVRLPARVVSAGLLPSPGSAEPIRPIMVQTIPVKRSVQAGRGQAAAGAVATGQGDAGIALRQVASAGPIAMAASERSSERTGATRSSSTGGWLIQIGALPSEDAAKDRIKAAQSLARTMLAAAEPFTERVANKGGTLYRARFGGLDKDAAEAACKYLKRNEIACLALKN